jgi:carbon storage regulator
MLVLSRHIDESIIIEGGIKITVVDIRGDKVRLGIEAPRELAVDREEVYYDKLDADRKANGGIK